METIFLLHGGRLKLKDKRNDSYFKRLTRDLNDGDTLLHVPFARRTEGERQDVFEREKAWILAQTDKKITVVKANESDFVQQLKAARAVHITGGFSPELLADIEQYPEFLSLLKGKVVGGSSAGACLFSKYYWYGEENTVHKGLEVLPIALFVHYGSEEFHATDTELELLKSYADNAELLTLEEAEWVERSVILGSGYLRGLEQGVS